MDFATAPTSPANSSAGTVAVEEDHAADDDGMMGITCSTFSKVNGEHGFSISVFLFADKDVGYAMDQSADSLENYNEPSREVSGIRTVMMLIHQQALIIVSSLVYFCLPFARTP